jgi:enoyl-CoA hydratase
MPVDYRIEGNIATLTLDDGKMNALSVDLLSEIGGALDRAKEEHAIVILTGREGVFSAGFDLRLLGAGGPDAYKMFVSGFRLAERILSFPAPIVVAGAHKIGANEVAIGLTMPHFGVEICRQRLTASHFHRAVINAEIFGPDDAVTAGFLDRVVPVAELAEAAHSIAVGLGRLDRDVHTATKLRARGNALKAVRAAIEADEAIFQGRL